MAGLLSCVFFFRFCKHRGQCIDHDVCSVCFANGLFTAFVFMYTMSSKSAWLRSSGVSEQFLGISRLAAIEFLSSDLLPLYACRYCMYNREPSIGHVMECTLQLSSWFHPFSQFPVPPLFTHFIFSHCLSFFLSLSLSLSLL